MPNPGFIRRLAGLVTGVDRSSRPRAIRRRSARVSDALGWAAWVAGLICGTLLVATPATNRNMAESATLGATAAMAVILPARLISSAIAWRERRVASIVMAISIVLWFIGSSVLSATKQPDLLRFPAPGEGFFIGSIVMMAVFLALDATDRGRITSARVLDAIVTCGGAVCLAGGVLLSPLHHRLGHSGAAEFLALLYPLFDLLLLVIVIADVALRRRGLGRDSAALASGFALLAVADSTFVRNLSSGVYDFSGTLALLWGIALTLLTAGACGPRSTLEVTDAETPAWAPLAASAAALGVLAAGSPRTGSLYLLVLAVITLLAAGIRLALALRAARGAAEAYRLSLTDDLTGLPNRRALLGEISDHLASGSAISLLLVDLDGFKEVNDTLGHSAGDSVLRLLATRLRGGLGAGRPGVLGALGPGAMLARLGGDEFAVVLPYADTERALQTASGVRELIAEQIEAHEHLFTMNASVGIAVRAAPGAQPSAQREERALDSSELLRRADIAMYQAKTTRAGQLLYDRTRDEFTTDRLKLAEYLRYGIAAGELRVWYQPQVETSDGTVSGLEALVRWQHPELGLLTPADFLTIARHSGLMPALTEAVMELVLNDVRTWTARGMRHRVSFNFAPPELLNASLLERVLARVDEMRLPPESLVLEVTEDSFLAEPERAKHALIGLRRHEVQVAIDDYGTGYSSLSYLRDLPVHELKLDRSFIKDVATDRRSSIIVESTAQMARGLGLRTVAEGVEDATILDRVATLGIDVVQGYHIARPMPSAHVTEWITNHNAARARPGLSAAN